ncbi:hypothetical protein E2C01_043569 [Portunus trituberculatus]|uniref:Uncharacterized protein n=1 Tax=Portunus trituberculatus TaxID=210409 RepID=A0A5B7FW31_PORTR|nr:hypothetical protein [Portunus trituberculatus]
MEHLSFLLTLRENFTQCGTTTSPQPGLVVRVRGDLLRQLRILWVLCDDATPTGSVQYLPQNYVYLPRQSNSSFSEGKHLVLSVPALSSGAVPSQPLITPSRRALHDDK